MGERLEGKKVVKVDRQLLQVGKFAEKFKDRCNLRGAVNVAILGEDQGTADFVSSFLWVLVVAKRT